QLKVLPLCIYATILLMFSYWILLSDTITVFGSEMYGFGKWLWAFTGVFMIGFSATLLIASLSSLAWWHLLSIYLSARIDSMKALFYSSRLLFFGYLIFF